MICWPLHYHHREEQTINAKVFGTTTRKKDINSVGEFDLLKNYGHSGPQRTGFITKLYKQANNRSALLSFHLRSTMFVDMGFI